MHRNFAKHYAQFPKTDPYGGGFTSQLFTMRFLYDEFCMHHNYWSRSNENLELVRYRGCRFKLYRHPDTDFIFVFNRTAPFKDSQITGPATHPGILLNSKHKIFVPSFKTKPKGRTCIKVNVRPPNLYTDKWYFQRDFCQVPLVTVRAVAASLRFPFCSPQTNNICIYFQVLSNVYKDKLSIVQTTCKTNYDNFITFLTD